MLFSSSFYLTYELVLFFFIIVTFILIGWVMFSNFQWRVYDQFLSWKTTWLNDILSPQHSIDVIPSSSIQKCSWKSLGLVWIVCLFLFCLFLWVEVYGSRGRSGMIVTCFCFYFWMMWKIFSFLFCCYLTSPECILVWVIY